MTSVSPALPESTIENNSNQEKVDNVVAQPIVEAKGEDATIDPNWKAFREARKKDRIEKEAAERKAAEKEAEVAALKSAMEAAFAKNNPVMHSTDTPSYYQEQEESEDEKIEKKVQAIIAKKEAEAERIRTERERQEYPQRLVSTYSDFNQLVSSENLDYLEYHYPEVAIPLKRLTDGFDKWSDIYKAIKKFVPNHSTAKKEAIRAENNFNKPKSISSQSLTQSGEAISSARLTEEKRAANWERMQKLLKSVG